VFGTFFVKVDNKECFGGHDAFAAVVFFAFDAAVSSCKFGAEGFGYLDDVPGY